jgi:hypothetical protein
MHLQWKYLLQSVYERYLEPDFDHSGQPLPVPILVDECLTGPERILRGRLEYTWHPLQLSVHPQSQMETATNINHESSVLGGYSTTATSRTTVATGISVVRKTINSASTHYPRYG